MKLNKSDEKILQSMEVLEQEQTITGNFFIVNRAEFLEMTGLSATTIKTRTDRLVELGYIEKSDNHNNSYKIL